MQFQCINSISLKDLAKKEIWLCLKSKKLNGKKILVCNSLIESTSWPWSIKMAAAIIVTEANPVAQVKPHLLKTVQKFLL